MEENIKSLSELLQHGMQDIQNAASYRNSKRYQSDIKGLDDLLHNFFAGTLVTIGGLSGMGKTTFALNLVNEFAIKQRHPLLFFSLEGTYSLWTNRLISIVCNVSTTALVTGKMIPQEWQILDEFSKIMKDAPIYLEAKKINHIDRLCEVARQAKEEHGIHIIFIDYVQLLNAREGFSDNRYLDLNYITRRLKELAKELEVPIVILSQLSRHKTDGEDMEEKRPRLTDLRDSGTIEEDSDMVILLHRPEYFHVYQDRRGNELYGIMEISVEKNRCGGLGRCYVKLNASTGLIKDVTDSFVSLDGFKSANSDGGNSDLPPLPPPSPNGPMPF